MCTIPVCCSLLDTELPVCVDGFDLTDVRTTAVDDVTAAAADLTKMDNI